jgi:hypothetical protein
VAGVAVFLATGIAVMLTGGAFLEYPAALAGSLILLIEVAATISIAAILISAFNGGRALAHQGARTAQTGQPLPDSPPPSRGNGAAEC